MDGATMMEIYPFGGVMAYLKYHYLDGVSKQNLLLTDKTRYNYDKEDTKTTIASKPKDENTARDIASAFGIGTKSKPLTEMEQVRKEIGD